MDLRVRSDQERFVAPVVRYLALCAYGGLGWHANVIQRGGDVVGFVMDGTEEDDNSYWIGGLLVESAHQGQGIGRDAMVILIDRGRALECETAALSYESDNLIARELYRSLGFVETGEMEGEETVARLPLG